VQRGASPAEAATAAALTRRLACKLAQTERLRHPALAPGVHVTII
jgi:hypothetical protein